jgi:hypothetical protein
MTRARNKESKDLAENGHDVPRFISQVGEDNHINQESQRNPIDVGLDKGQVRMATSSLRQHSAEKANANPKGRPNCSQQITPPTAQHEDALARWNEILVAVVDKSMVVSGPKGLARLRPAKGVPVIHSLLSVLFLRSGKFR